MKKSFLNKVLKIIMIALIILTTYGVTSANYVRKIRSQKATYECEISILKTQHFTDSIDIAMYKNLYEVKAKKSDLYEDLYEIERNHNRRLLNILRRY